MYNPFCLEDKLILITGASGGIGRAVATECSRLGAVVVITGRNQDRLNETFSILEGSGHKQILSDLADERGIDILMSELTELDGIVHCAGIADPIPFQFIDRGKLNNIMNINILVPVLISQKLIKRKILRNGSSIVFISSISGVYVSSIAGALYSSTKGAINGAIKGMALDLSQKGIRVNSVCPGMIQTDIYEDGRISPEQLKNDVNRYPLKRYGKPEEVAYAVIYLLSDTSKWVTGSNLLIDGGYTLL